MEKSVASLIQEEDEMITIDIKDGFHQGIHVKHQKYLGLQWKNQFYVWCALPFGAACSPYFFNKLIRPVLAHLRENNIRVAVFVDDFLQMMRWEEQREMKALTLSCFNNLGLTINEEKSQLQATTCVTFVGFKVHSQGNNGPYLTVLPEKNKETEALSCENT